MRIRKGMVLVTVLLLVLVMFSATSLNVSGTGGLVSHWKFNEGSGTTAYDSAGDNDGALKNGAGYATDGVCGYALELDGEDDYCEVPDDDTLDITDEITIEAWINPEVTSVRYVVQKGWFAGQTGVGGVYSLDLFPGKLRGVLVEPDGTFHGLVGTTIIKIGEWQHIAMTWDGSTQKVYYNGNLENSASFTGSIATSTGEVLIGRYGSLYFEGLIDDVRIYNKGLTADEIEASYEAGRACLEAEDADVDMEPDNLNPKSKGKYVTAYIEVPGCDVSEIDISTVHISKIGDSAVGLYAMEHPTEIGDNDNDGEMDLMVKFSRQALLDELDDHEDDGEALMVMQGDFEDGSKWQELGRWVFTGAGWKYFDF